MYLCPHVNELCKNSNFAVFFLDIFISFCILSLLFIVLFIKPILVDNNIISSIIGSKLLSIIEKEFREHALKLLVLGYLSLLLFIIITTSIYNNVKDRLPFKYDTYKFVLILMILVIVFEFTIYHLMYNSHQSNYVIDIVKSLSFNEISLLVFTDLVFITSVFLLAVFIHKHKLDSKWYVLTLTVLSLIYLISS